ncbi:MAG: right-handed parallel beta-helix repeat-containing protein [Bacteroidota bacterium]
MTLRSPHVRLLSASASLTVALLASSSFAATLRVGPTRTYTTISAAAAAAQNGDSVLIDAGTYTGDVCSWNASNLVVRAVGGRAILNANGLNAAGKGTWVVVGGNFVAENIEFYGATCVDLNGAGIRSDAPGYLVIRNCYFHDNQDGVLAGADSMLIESCIFDHNGAGDGRSHNMYIWGRSVTVRYTYTHRAVIGHNLKTRGQNNYILYNRIMDESDGTASYSIDVPDCGRTYIVGNVIEQGPNTDNSTVISYGAESSLNTQDLYVVNNTIVNDRTAGGNFLSIGGSTPTQVRNNIFYGTGTPWSGGSVTSSNNYVHTAYDNAPGFASPTTYDFHLTSASPAAIVDAGASPGSSSTGYPLTPTGEYVYDAQGKARAVSGALDIGSFEYVSGSMADATPPSPIFDLTPR